VKILVVDVGGSHVKLLASGQDEPRRFDSGPDLTPAEAVARVKKVAAGWDYDIVTLGYPGAVGPHGPIADPGNLGPGWVGYDFVEGFGRPVRIVNDAALQALGGYSGGRMLFLGLGTGLGSTVVAERVVVPLELGSLAWEGGRTLAEHLGKAGLEADGFDAWHATLEEAVPVLRAVFLADYVLLGGGNVERLDPLPEGCRRGGNDDAFAGGFLVWEEEVEPHDRKPADTWRIVR